MRRVYLLTLGLLFVVIEDIMMQDCSAGYKKQRGTCVDKDECEQELLVCGENANCFNTAGSYYCQCHGGFRAEGNKKPFNFTQADGIQCKDIDECVNGSNICGPNAECINNEGDFACMCRTGFTANNGKLIFVVRQGVQCFGLKIALEEGCTNQTSKVCLENLLEQTENIKDEELPLNTVTSLLNMVLDAAVNISVSSSSANPNELTSYGNRLLKSNEELMSTLVKPTNTSANVSFILTGVEGRVFMVGPHVTLVEIPRLHTTTCSIDIDLIGIAKNNNETSAVIFLGYTAMENLLKADFFNATNNTVNTMMSSVISVTLPKTTNTALSKPVNFTFRHIREFDSSGSMHCVYWNISEWIVDGCSVLNTNSSFTMCSCVHLSTFALIMQTSSHPPKNDSLLNLLNVVFVIVGLLFFILALLTFALCQWSPGVNNVARINICISLLLAHLLFLLTQQFLSLIRRQKVLCELISRVLHFLFLSGFVWMFIEAVLLLICVKNLSQLSSQKKNVFRNIFLCVIGYGVALIVVGISAAVVPNGYGSEKCWIKMDKGFIWSFLGPVTVILALNIILFISIGISLNSAFKKLNADVSQLKQTKIIMFKTLAQFVVLGCSWILGFFTNSSKVLEILFLILNSQQGTFIFLIYCVLNKGIMQEYRKLFTSLSCGLKPKNINWFSENTEDSTIQGLQMK
ncbi:adhesion G protein-coupled receptor E2-like isoform X2 [Danio aesculapii]|uniref:adhesion G protein-coupled receptor E2-like isoform X2 n=1 Tax=Danio aesculapii TaxID=1142201 RepID=UPI0024C05443|nr:adhesion G protein-coupled receptor E2-like isoform X2 [Danio aesculapii]